MDVVIALPMKNQQMPPVLADRSWEPGALRVITPAGAPGAPVADLVRVALPSPIRSTLDRMSVSLWRDRIEINHSLDVVGLEWLSNSGGLPDLLLIHIEDSAQYRASVTDGYRKRDVEELTRTKNKKVSEFLGKIFLGEVETHGIATRGLAIIHESAHLPEVISGGDHLLEFLTEENKSRFIHGRCTHVLTVVALQSFAVEILNNSWPSSSHSKKEVKEFGQKFIDYRHYLEWNDAFVDLDSRTIYRELRALQSIESRFDAFGRELQDLHRRIEVSNSSALNRIGLVIAISALIPVWLTADLQSLNNPQGIAGLSVALTITAFVVWLGRKK